MGKLSHSELNSLREIVVSHQTMSSKFASYSEQVQDPSLKQMFAKASQESHQSAQNLIQMI
jgi:hypothetical protein